MLAVWAFMASSSRLVGKGLGVQELRGVAKHRSRWV